MANYLDNSISVVGSTADAMITTIPVGERPCRVATDGARAFIVNNCDDSLSVIDTATARVVDTIAVGRSPFDVTLSADSGRACVQHRDGLSMVAV